MLLVVAFCVVLLGFAQSAVAQTAGGELNLQPNRVRTISITPPAAQKPAPTTVQRSASRSSLPRSEQIPDHLDGLVAKHAATHGVPESLVRRVIKIESGGNPKVISKGNYGLMQIRHGTARSMGYAGDTDGLLDADTNMTYAVKYLAGAYRAAGGNSDRAISLYQRGYYYEAKAKGFSPYDARPAKQAPVLASVEPAETVAAPKPERVKRTAVALREPAPAMVPIPVAAPLRAAAPVIAAPAPVVASPILATPAPVVVAAREPVAIPVAAPQPETKLEAAAAPVAAVAPAVARKGDRLVVAPLQAKPDQHAALQAEPAPVPIPTPRARTRRGHEEQPRSLFTDLKAEIVQAQGPATTQPATTRRPRRSDLMMAASPQAEPVQAQPQQQLQRRSRASRQADKQAAGKPFDLSVFVKSFAAQDQKPPSRRRAQPQTPSQPPS
jgi:hypothetical protein